MLQQIRFIAGKEQFRKAPIKTAARLCSWKLHCLASKEAVVRLEGTPLRISLPPQWHGHSKLIYALGWRFDPELPFLASKLPDGAVVFDIGANVGAWSLILSHAVGPRGRIFAYEPTQATYDTLSRNVELNSATNIFPFRYALSDSNSQLRLYHHVDCSRNSLGPFDDTAGYEDAPSRRLDDVAAKLKLDRLDFIKVDVEGAEPLVLNGSLSTIRQFKPAVLFEVNPTALAALGYEYNSSWNILANLGYRFYELRSDRLEPLADCPGGMANLWAIHPLSRFRDSANITS